MLVKLPPTPNCHRPSITSSSIRPPSSLWVLSSMFMRWGICNVFSLKTLFSLWLRRLALLGARNIRQARLEQMLAREASVVKTRVGSFDTRFTNYIWRGSVILRHSSTRTTDTHVEIVFAAYGKSVVWGWRIGSCNVPKCLVCRLKVTS